MTRLLVSVRSLSEAQTAAAAGVALVDLKEPRHGALGRVSMKLAAAVSELLSPVNLLSMALGEMPDWSDEDWRSIACLPPGIRFAKIGLAGCAGDDAWRSTWRRALAFLPAHAAAVAVVYADWRLAHAPAPADVLAEAMLNGCRALLVDTWSKDGRNVFAHSCREELWQLLQRARQAGLLTVLAGSLRLDDLTAALALRPDYVAVRGAVCRDSREGQLCPAKLAAWVEALGRASRHFLT